MAHLRLVTTDRYPEGEAGGRAPTEGGELGATQRVILQYLRHRAATVAPLTLRNERTILMAWANQLGRRHLRQVGPAAIEDWLTSIADKAPTTRRARFTIVRSFLGWCVEQNHLPRNPAERIPTPKVPRATHRSLNCDQAAQLLAACEGPRDRLIVLLGLQLGLRRAEIAALTIDDIEWSDRIITVTGKGGHERRLWIPDELAEAIDTYLSHSPAIHGPLIRGDKYPTSPVQPVWVGRRVTALARAAGVKRQAWDGVSAHALRHTAGTDVARSTNGDVVAVRDFLGHANLATTQVYVSGDPLRLRAAIDGRRYSRGVRRVS